MTEQEAIAALDAINSDPESAHMEADDILMDFVLSEVAAAYSRAAGRAGSWWYA